MANFKFARHCRKCPYFMTTGGVCCGYLLITGKSLLREFGYVNGAGTTDPKEVAKVSNDIRNRCQHYKDVVKRRRLVDQESFERMKKRNDRRMELYKAGLSDTKIAEIEGVSANTICSWRKYNSLKPNYRATEIRKEKEKKYFELYQQKYTDEQIARECGVSTSLIEKWRRREHLPCLNYKAPKRIDDSIFMEAYLSSNSDKELAKKIGRVKSTVQKMRYARNLPPPSQKSDLVVKNK